MTDFYQNKKILLAVSGGIAAYKSAELVRSLVKAGAEVQVTMTETAEEFIPAKTLAILSKNPVLTDAHYAKADVSVQHVALARWADIVLVAPATANTIAKLALGMADNALTSTVLASPAKKVLAPAMNDVMWANSAVKRNINQLVQDGWLMIGPETGFLAEGYQAKGRMTEPADIVHELASSLQEKTDARDALTTLKPLSGKKVVVTAGGTKEPIDPVRYLTNKSSGKMGYALAEAALSAGADVTLIAAVNRPISAAIDLKIATQAREMLEVVQREMQSADVFIGSAAVSDYRVAQVAENKVKKVGDEHLVLDLIQNPDILKTVGHAKKTGQIVVGFAAETENLLENAGKKLISKNADLIVANNVLESQAGFDKDTNKVTLLSLNHDPITIDAKLKTEVAEDIIAVVADLLTTN